MKQSRCIDSLKDVFTGNPGLSRKAATIVPLLLFAVLFTGNVLAQNPLYEKVKADYPSLTSIYGDRLEKQKAHYIFAIDVSTVMRDNIKTIKTTVVQDDEAKEVKLQLKEFFNTYRTTIANTISHNT